MGSNEDHSLRFATPAPQQSSQKSGDNFPTENAPSETARTTIEFPPAHPLCQLRNLFCKSEEEPPPLSLCLFPEESRIPLGIVKNISCEIEIMKLSLTHTAEKRLRQISPDQTQSNADEQVYLYLSCDRMAAWVMLFPPTGSGKALTVPQLQRTLLHRGVIFGIDQLLLRRLPTLENRFFRLFPIAWGLLPADGADGRILDRFPRTDTAKQAQVKELGQADYVSLHLVQDVKQGDVICEIVPPEPGSSGSTVTGESLPCRDGTPAPVPQGRNTHLSNDGKYLLASQPGHVEFSGRNFQVKPVLEILGNVDHTTGSVNFLGDVHIHGDICRGFTVRAMGNVQVDGVVEASTIEAGENVVVSSGVLGQDQAVIRSHKSVYAKYLEHSNVYARESVQADCIIDCNIFSNGTVTARTGRGAIIGGTVRSSREVSAITVGSKAEKRTAIVLGGQPCENFEHAQILVEMERITCEIEKLKAQPATPQQKSKLAKARLDMNVAQMKLEKLGKDLAAQQPPDPCDDHRRLICDAAYPGTIITINHASLRIKQIESHCKIGLDNGLVGHIHS